MSQPASCLVSPALRASAPAVSAQTTPSCTRCASADTSPMARMQRHTCDTTDAWVECNVCGYVFAASRD